MRLSAALGLLAAGLLQSFPAFAWPGYCREGFEALVPSARSDQLVARALKGFARPARGQKTLEQLRRLGVNVYSYDDPQFARMLELSKKLAGELGESPPPELADLKRGTRGIFIYDNEGSAYIGLSSDLEGPALLDVLVEESSHARYEALHFQARNQGSALYWDRRRPEGKAFETHAMLTEFVAERLALGAQRAQGSWSNTSIFLSKLAHYAEERYPEGALGFLEVAYRAMKDTSKGFDGLSAANLFRAAHRMKKGELLDPRSARDLGLEAGFVDFLDRLFRHPLMELPLKEKLSAELTRLGFFPRRLAQAALDGAAKESRALLPKNLARELDLAESLGRGSGDARAFALSLLDGTEATPPGRGAVLLWLAGKHPDILPAALKKASSWDAAGRRSAFRALSHAAPRNEKAMRALVRDFPPSEELREDIRSLAFDHWRYKGPPRGRDDERLSLASFRELIGPATEPGHPLHTAVLENLGYSFAAAPRLVLETLEKAAHLPGVDADALRQAVEAAAYEAKHEKKEFLGRIEKLLPKD